MHVFAVQLYRYGVVDLARSTRRPQPEPVAGLPTLQNQLAWYMSWTVPTAVTRGHGAEACQTWIPKWTHTQFRRGLPRSGRPPSIRCIFRSLETWQVEVSVFTFGIVAVSRRAGLYIAKTTPGAKIRLQSLLSKKLNASSTVLWRKVSCQGGNDRRRGMGQSIVACPTVRKPPRCGSSPNSTGSNTRRSSGARKFWCVPWRAQ